MSATVKAIEAAIGIKQRRLAKLESLQNDNPLESLFEARSKAFEILHDQTIDIETRVKLIKPFAKQEEKASKAFKRQNRNYMKWNDELIKLDREIIELSSDLALLKMRKRIA